VLGEFWIDLYVNPTEEPRAVNKLWESLGTQGTSWDVTMTIQPGEILTLTVGEPYYHAEYSQIS
jgi:hypothetical protein